MQPVLFTVSSAAPATVIPQNEVWDDFFSHIYSGLPDARRLFVDASRVERRHFTWDPRLAYRNGFPALGDRMDAWEREALDLGRRTIPAALGEVDPARVGTVIMASTTGYTCPGPETQLAQELSLRPDVRRIFIGHMGCFAALVALRAALDALAARPDELVLLTCTELTSLHHRPDATIEQAVVHGLFGDASATVLVGTAATLDSPATPAGATSAATPLGATVVATRSEITPGTTDHMAIRFRGAGLHLSLSPKIPALLAGTTPPFVEKLLADAGLTVADVPHWAVHPGGPRIVDQVGAALGLSDDQLRPAREILRDYGNCSSATVLLVLERLVTRSRPRPGEHAVMIAFGPGLTTEAALLRF